VLAGWHEHYHHHERKLSGYGELRAATYQVRIATSSQPAFFQIGNSPTATTSSPVIGTNMVDYFAVSPGQAVAVLQAGTAGVISEIS